MWIKTLNVGYWKIMDTYGVEKDGYLCILWKHMGYMDGYYFCVFWIHMGYMDGMDPTVYYGYIRVISMHITAVYYGYIWGRRMRILRYILDTYWLEEWIKLYVMDTYGVDG